MGCIDRSNVVLPVHMSVSCGMHYELKDRSNVVRYV